jgi:hypothetical protein
MQTKLFLLPLWLLDIPSVSVFGSLEFDTSQSRQQAVFIIFIALKISGPTRAFLDNVKRINVKRGTRNVVRTVVRVRARIQKGNQKKTRREKQRLMTNRTRMKLG